MLVVEQNADDKRIHDIVRHTLLMFNWMSLINSDLFWEFCWRNIENFIYLLLWCKRTQAFHMLNFEEILSNDFSFPIVQRNDDVELIALSACKLLIDWLNQIGIPESS